MDTLGEKEGGGGGDSKGPGRSPLISGDVFGIEIVTVDQSQLRPAPALRRSCRPRWTSLPPRSSRSRCDTDYSEHPHLAPVEQGLRRNTTIWFTVGARPAYAPPRHLSFAVAAVVRPREPDACSIPPGSGLELDAVHARAGRCRKVADFPQYSGCPPQDRVALLPSHPPCWRPAYRTVQFV